MTRRWLVTTMSEKHGMTAQELTDLRTAVTYEAGKTMSEERILTAQELAAIEAKRLPNIFEALADVMADVTHVGKTGFNDSQNYSFRGIDAVVNAIGPVLRDNRVLCIPKVLRHEYSEIEVGHNRSKVGHALVTVRYTFIAPDGSSLCAVAPGEAMDSGDKATPKAMSVAFRTALLQTLVLPTDEPDPDATSYDRGMVDTQLPPSPAEAAFKARQDLLNWMTAFNIPMQAGLDRWGKDHFGEHIKDVTDADALRAFMATWQDEIASATPDAP